MRTDLAAALSAVVVTAALGLAAGAARAQDHQHDAPAELSLSDLKPEERNRALDAWAHVVCNCERENWSRTLANCPDGCSLPQKQQVLQRITEGWSLDRIVEEQVKLYGDKAAADPGTAVNGTFLVLAGLVLGGAAAGLVLARWQRGAEARRTGAEDARRLNPVESAESDAVERELREIE